jgi:hypothetical protein
MYFSAWSPSFILTPAIALSLMQIGAVYIMGDHTPLLPPAEAELYSHAGNLLRHKSVSGDFDIYNIDIYLGDQNESH